MYSNEIIKIFCNPVNTGRISKPDGIADLYNEDKTSHVEFSIRVESGIITNCQFRAQANPYIVAVCSKITEMVKGKMAVMVFLDPYSVKLEVGQDLPIDIQFCIDCFKMALNDHKDKLAKSMKVKEDVKVEQTEQPKEDKQIEEDEDFDLFGDF